MNMAMAHDDDYPAVPRDTFAARLILIRHELGMLRHPKKALTVEEIAALCDLKPATWSTWERGTIPHDQIEVCRKIAAATTYDFDWLLKGGLTLCPQLMLTTADPYQLSLDDEIALLSHRPAQLLVVT